MRTLWVALSLGLGAAAALTGAVDALANITWG
jgi:hypothetical protein